MLTHFAWFPIIRVRCTHVSALPAISGWAVLTFISL